MPIEEKTAHRLQTLGKFNREYGPFSEAQLAGVGQAYDQLVTGLGGEMFAHQPVKNAAKALACGLIAAHLTEYVKRQQ